MTYSEFIAQCKKMKSLGWKAWKKATGGIGMEKNGNHWITNPLCAVCSEVGNTTASMSLDSIKGLQLGPRVGDWIDGASEYPSDMLRTPGLVRCRRELLKALKLPKDR